MNQHLWDFPGSSFVRSILQTRVGPVAWLQVEEASDLCRKRFAGCCWKAVESEGTAVVDCHLKNIQTMCRHAKDAACSNVSDSNVRFLGNLSGPELLIDSSHFIPFLRTLSDHRAGDRCLCVLQHRDWLRDRILSRFAKRAAGRVSDVTWKTCTTYPQRCHAVPTIR